jgi:hypothetical protein
MCEASSDGRCAWFGTTLEGVQEEEEEEEPRRLEDGEVGVLAS